MFPSPQPLPGSTRLVQTVTGPVPFPLLGLTDAHNHVWIDPVADSDPASPVLNQFHPICAELYEYHKAGGDTILDCQPAGCGRNGNSLRELARASGVKIVACTGFHLRKYYSPDFWLWRAKPEGIASFMASELSEGLAETRSSVFLVRAGFIKIAIEASLENTPAAALEGAALCASQTGAMLEIHTEKGAMAHEVAEFFLCRGVGLGQLVLCHMDKRADFGLHKELAQAGVLLEYDTFYRPKYQPEENLWPLIEKMVAAGLANRVALATDMADRQMYHNLGGGPGLASLPTHIRKQLLAREIPQVDLTLMLGDNIARRLVGLPE